MSPDPQPSKITVQPGGIRDNSGDVWRWLHSDSSRSTTRVRRTKDLLGVVRKGGAERGALRVALVKAYSSANMETMT